MTLQSAASDLALIDAAVREAGALARELVRRPLAISSKGAAGPVTNVDIEVNALLCERLCGARPDYGWLSEESPDDPEARSARRRVFVVDPIDGTSALVARVPQFTISVGLVEDGRALTGVIYNPLTDEMFSGGINLGVKLNGQPMRASARNVLEGARIVGKRSQFVDAMWKPRWPQLEFVERQSIAYRLAAVGAGQADAAILFGPKHEWDVAAGAALVTEAGGVVSDLAGAPLQFNRPQPRVPGVIASGAGLHALIVERTRSFGHNAS